jgi:hypothetical protein
MWKDATRMYSTWRSDESKGYCDLHRRDFEARGAARWSAEGRRTDLELLGALFLTTEGDGDNRGKPLDFEGFDREGNGCAASSGGR